MKMSSTHTLPGYNYFKYQQNLSKIYPQCGKSTQCFMLSEIGYRKSCAKETVKWFRRELGTISCGMISSISDEVCMLAASIYILASACLIRPKPLGAHITSDFPHKILIQLLALIQNILNGSSQNCARATWHVQKFAGIWWPGTALQDILFPFDLIYAWNIVSRMDPRAASTQYGRHFILPCRWW